MKREKVMKRLDQLIETGRLTADEAALLRSAQGDAEFDAAARQVRQRHVHEEVDAAVTANALTREEGNALANELLACRDPRRRRQLRNRLHQARLRPARPHGS